MQVRTLFPLVAGLALAGCASYTRLSLPRHETVAASVALLTRPAADFKVPGAKDIPIDPAQPLDADAVAALAVLNDPALVAARAQRGVAEAQSFAAGLIPWPQISLGAGQPRPSAPGVGNTWVLALNQDMVALLQHGTRKRGARAAARQVRLDVIWDEWQVAQQARLLYADMEMMGAERDAIAPLVRLYERQAKAADASLERHDLSQSAALQVEAARASTLAESDTIGVEYEKDMDALRGLLGLAPDVSLHLAFGDHPLAPDARTFAAAIAALPARRPDLLALAAAFRHADERLHGAVLAQFPLIGVAVRRERDTEGVAANSFSLTFTLPFLNGARADVAVARASRAAVEKNYEARLDEAVARAESLKSEAGRLHRTLADLRKSWLRLPAAPESASSGSVSFAKLAVYAEARLRVASKIARLQHSLDETVIALETLLGMPLDAGGTGDGDSA